MRARLETKGFEEYLARVAEAGKDVDKVAGAMLAAGGAILLDGMKQRVPKDTHNLENHLECTEPAADGNFIYVEIGIGKDTDPDTARYGNVQEFGSAHTPAQPYIRPTLDEDLTKARAAMRAVAKESGIL